MCDLCRFTTKQSNKLPYRCPVCRGNGQVDNGFYNQTTGDWSSTSTAPETCRSCQGTGVVWGWSRGS